MSRRRRPRKKRPPYHPIHWPLWLIIGLLRLCAFLPYRVHLALGRGLGWLMRRVARRRIRIATWNIERCFPGLSADERARLIDAHFEALGIMTFETVLSWWAPDRRLAALARYEGWEHVERALAGGKGVILLSAHFTSLEIGGRFFRMRSPMHPMYKPNRNVVIEHVMRTRRLEYFQTLIPMDDIRQLLRSLKANHPVWYAPDQGFLGKGMLMVPFFGIEAPTNPATSRLARMSGAPVVPFFTHRRDDGTGYLLRFLPALDGFPSGDLAADALRINRLLEDEVRQNPAEYLWAHNRFKWCRDGTQRRCWRQAGMATAATTAVASAAAAEADGDQAEE
jgi:KDO2-lipid IV(A) lauroyltransferase